MKVNIGKNTLGDNDKMTLSLREYGRSTHDLSFAWRSTMGVGSLVPFLRILALPGDTFEIDLENKILTAPTIGPLYGSFKFQADVFSCPIRLYNAMLHNNALKIGLDMAKVKLPKVKMERPKNGKGYFMGVSTSSLKNYLEYREAGNANAVPLLAYYDIFKNYYANKQENEFYMYSGVVPAKQAEIISSRILQAMPGYKYAKIQFQEGTKEEDLKASVFQISDSLGNKYEIQGRNLYGILDGKGKWESIYKVPNGVDASFKVRQLAKNEDDIKVIKDGNINNALEVTNFIEVTGQAQSIRKIEKYPLTQIDDLREYILSKGKQEVIFDQENYKVNDFLRDAIKEDTTKEDLGGLVLKTYLSDINNNWINQEWVEGDNGIAKLTSIDTSSGSFTMDTLNLAKKVYEMLNRIAISGGTYKDWIETVYTTDYYFRAETPVYEGGMSSEIEFEAITSLSASQADGYEPLGTLAGRGVNNSKKGGKITIKINEPSYIIGICSITPRLDYSQGQPFDITLDTLNDIHKPQLDGIGYEDRMLTRLDWKAKNSVSIGKQPAWVEYTTNINKTFGKFAVGQEQEYMCLNRVYETEFGGGISNFSTYIEPELYNKIFATTGNQEQNFMVQIGCGIEARRVMSARQIPNF